MPVMIFSQLAGSLMLVAILPWLPPANANSTDFVWGAVAGVALGLGLTQLYQSLAIGKMSVVAPMTAVFAVVVSALVGITGGDRLSGTAFGGVALAIGAIVLISQDGAPKTAAEEQRSSVRTLIMALFAGFLIGVFFVALKQSGASAGLLPLLSARVTTLGVLAALVFFFNSPLSVRIETVWLILLGGVLDVMANVLYVLAARHGMLTIAATLTSLYPVSTILLARFVLGERLRAIQIAGLSCAGLGVALIGAG
jgi:drug/metabolite transporter (DMT)-like permease